MIENADKNRFAGMLSGKRVVFATTASISLYRVPDLIRDLRREGAEVHVCMSREASELVSPKIMEWASGNDVVTEITGKIEHITLFKGPAAGTSLLMAPCTHNIIGKAANGISDDVPSTFFSFASGNGNKIVMAPAMHEGMLRNPANARNIESLIASGVDIVPPVIAEEKAKLSASDEILDHVCRSFFHDVLRDRKIMIIGGHTEEGIDPVRSVSNHGTGFTGYWLAKIAFRLGASAITYIGNCTETIPSYVKFIEAASSSDIENAVKKELNEKYDIVASPAAISDFTVNGKHAEKLPGSSPHQVSLEPRSKVIDDIRKMHSGVLIAFNLTDKKSVDEIRRKFKGSIPDMIISNTFSSGKPFGQVQNDYEIITENETEKLEGFSKPVLALNILKRAAKKLYVKGTER